jgi:hypothetical protein
MDSSSWLLLIYKVPPEPGKKRIALWRKIKAMGAVYLQNGVCLLPKTEDHQRQFKILQNEITNMEGESLLLETFGFDKRQEELVIRRFNEDRGAEYQEFLGQCADYVTELRKETEAKHFRYAELEENHEEIKKLRSWLEKIKKLDFYGAPLAAQADEQLQLCERLLEEFSQKVFAAEEQDMLLDVKKST